MGGKYTVMAWGRHDGPDDGYSDRCMYQGNSLLRAVFALYKHTHLGFGCVTLEVRGAK